MEMWIGGPGFAATVGLTTGHKLPLLAWHHISSASILEPASRLFFAVVFNLS